MFLTVVLVSLTLMSAQDVTLSRSGIIRISLTGLESQQGQVIALLFDEEAGTMTDPSLALAGSYADIGGEKTEIAFLGIPWGNYAVIVFQDRDEDGEPDCSFGEGSVEPFGVSGMELPEGRPTISFENCCFIHESDETGVEIVMISAPAGSEGRPGPGGPGGMPGGGPGGGGPGR